MPHASQPKPRPDQEQTKERRPCDLDGRREPASVDRESNEIGGREHQCNGTSPAEHIGNREVANLERLARRRATRGWRTLLRGGAALRRRRVRVMRQPTAGCVVLLQEVNGAWRSGGRTYLTVSPNRSLTAAFGPGANGIQRTIVQQRDKRIGHVSDTYRTKALEAVRPATPED